MEHGTELVTTIAVALAAGFVGGFAAKRIGVSPIAGYLLGGIAIGPHAPGLVADPALATQLAEIGVALLMFGVGLHFSVPSLLAVRGIAIPGALMHGAVASALGFGAGVALGFGVGGGVVIGLAISVASTVVLVRALAEHRLLDTTTGRAAVGWLLVEDLLTVAVLVLLPSVAPHLGGTATIPEGGTLVPLALSFAKVGGMAAIVLLLGGRVVPWLLDRVALQKSRELFTLAVLAIALGIAHATSLATGTSMALGAFLAGMVVGQTDMSHQAAADSLPLRDAFAVLFFVSVGMLFDPRVVVEAPALLAATVAIVVLASPLVALSVVLALGHPLRMGLVIAAGLAQIGEFSFILAALGTTLGLLSQSGHDVILATALVSITLNPLLFRLVEPLEAFARRSPRASALLRSVERRGAAPEPRPPRAGHILLCGYGRVGTIVGRIVAARGWPLTVVEQDRARIARLRERGIDALPGDAGSSDVLQEAGLATARLVVVTMADPVVGRLAVEHARAANPDAEVIVRVRSRGERDLLKSMHRVQAVMGEFEAALEITRRVMDAQGVSPLENDAVIHQLRSAERGEAMPSGPSLVELTVTPGAVGDGRAIAEIGLPVDALVVQVTRGGLQIVPRGGLVLAAGDALLVVAPMASMRKAAALLTDA